jgi:four helix bundle protein
MTPRELRERLAAFEVAVEAFSRPLLTRLETRDQAVQLRRASSAAASNHRSAGRGRSHAEFTAKLGVALEEMDESQGRLEYFQATDLAPKAPLQPLLKEAGELVAILTTSYETAKRHRR